MKLVQLAVVSIVEVLAEKPCEGEFRFTTGTPAQALNVCGPTRTCKPCIARSIIKEAEGLELLR